MESQFRTDSFEAHELERYKALNENILNGRVLTILFIQGGQIDRERAYSSNDNCLESQQVIRNILILLLRDERPIPIERPLGPYLTGRTMWGIMPWEYYSQDVAKGTIYDSVKINFRRPFRIVGITEKPKSTIIYFISREA